jgi:hypothetical protein
MEGVPSAGDSLQPFDDITTSSGGEPRPPAFDA